MNTNLGVLGIGFKFVVYRVSKNYRYELVSRYHETLTYEDALIEAKELAKEGYEALIVELKAHVHPPGKEPIVTIL